MRAAAFLLTSASLVMGCQPGVDPDEVSYEKVDEGKGDSSAIATILDFEFDGELVTDWVANDRQTVQDQLLFTIGHLNEQRSVGRLDRLVVSNVRRTTEGGKTRLTYHASMPVAWGSKTNLPTSYSFRLPRDISFAGQESFATKYKESCVDFGAHDVDSGSMWYYYRPEARGCQLDAADVVTLEATATVSTVNTTGKFPEYDQVWDDDVLEVVSIFGKYEDGATTSADAGIAAYNEFVGAVRRALPGVTTTPATVPTSPGVGTPDITFEATLAGGRRVKVTALLVDNVRTAGAAFDQRYATLSTTADLIAYNGHAGLGANVRALARKGRWVAGKYLIVFMNGCDTYAYVDGYMAEQRAALNPDDPTGTKYMEIVTNAMPSYFHQTPEASMALITGLLAHDAPRTYERMFRDIDRAQVVLVTGEQDNVFVPGGGGGGGTTWAGLTAPFDVARSAEQRWTTPTLRPGTYTFDITGTGDADLYVRIGSAPTTRTYDCRPYRNGSVETCEVTLTADAVLHVMVRGYSAATGELVAGPAQ